MSRIERTRVLLAAHHTPYSFPSCYCYENVPSLSRCSCSAPDLYRFRIAICRVQAAWPRAPSLLSSPLRSSPPHHSFPRTTVRVYRFVYRMVNRYIPCTVMLRMSSGGRHNTIPGSVRAIPGSVRDTMAPPIPAMQYEHLYIMPTYSKIEDAHSCWLLVTINTIILLSINKWNRAEFRCSCCAYRPTKYRQQQQSRRCLKTSRTAAEQNGPVTTALRTFDQRKFPKC